MENPESEKKQAVPKKMGFFKKVLLFFLVVFLLLFLAVATLPLYSSVLISYITGPASQITDRKISMEDLSINLLGSRISVENFEIKEENGVDNFFKVEKIIIDFSAVSMLSGKFNFPQILVSGIHAKVVVNEAGEANYQSIQQSVEKSQKKSSDKPETKESKPLASLPEVNAHIELSNINFTFENIQQKKRVELKNFGWKLDIDGLQDIRYRSSWEKLEVASDLEKILVSLVYLLEGSAKVAVKNGKFVMQANGQMGLTQISARQGEQNFMKDNEILFKHDLDIDLDLGSIDIRTLLLDTPYIKGEVSNVQIRKLNEFQQIVEMMATAKSKEEAQALLPKLSLEDWQGKFSLQVNLDEIQKTFGTVIAQKTEEKLNNFGGIFDLSGSWTGNSTGFQFTEKCLVNGIFLSGKLPQKDGNSKKYRLAMDVDQNFSSSAHLVERKIQTDSQMKITLPINRKNNVLFEHQQKAELLNGQSLQSWSLVNWNNSIMLNFDNLQELLKDFLPKGAQVSGLLNMKDEIQTIEKNMRLVGQTDLRVEVKTKKYPNLPGLQIKGDRDVSVVLDDRQFPQKIKIQKFDLKSANNKLLSMEGKGELDLQTFQNPTLQVALAIQFAELQPYLETFLEGIQLSGIYENTLRAKESNKRIILTKNGKLEGFMFNLPLLKEKSPIYPFQLNPLSWNSELVIGQEKQADIDRIVIYPSFIQFNQEKQKLLRCDYEAKISKQNEQVSLENAKLAVFLYAKPLQNLIPTHTIQDPQLLEMWTKNLVLGGVCSLECSAQALSANDVKISSKADFTGFSMKFQDAQKNILLNKTDKMPLSLVINTSMQKQDSTQVLVISGSSAQINQVKIPFGDMRIQDGKHITGTDGTSPVQVFELGPCKLSEFAEIIPIIQTMQLGTATLETRLDNFLVHAPEEKVQGKFFLRFHAPQMNLERIRQAGQKAREKEIVRERIQDRIQGEEPPLQKLTQKLRDTLKNIGIDVDIRVDKVIIDQVNQAEDLKLTFGLNHTEKLDNQAKLDITGRLGKGNILVKGVSDLDREHPEWKLDYDFREVPYIVDIFGGVTEKFDSVLQFPLLNNIKFKDQAEVCFGLKGSNSWHGIDPRGIKRSVVSGDDIILDLPMGNFDLGLDISKFLDIGALQEDIVKKLQPLEQALQPLKLQEGGFLQQIEAGEGKIQALRDSISGIRSKKQPIMDTLKGLELAAKYNPTMRTRLKEAQEKIGVFDKQLGDLEQQQKTITSAIEKQKANLQEIRNQIQAKEAELAKMREELQKNTKISNPFQFQFDKIQVKLRVSNDEIWPGKGTLEKILRHPFSRVNYVEITFQPNERKFPKITGWFSLDGKYRFNFLPTEELPPALGNFAGKIKEKGISWGSEGFDTKLFD